MFLLELIQPKIFINSSVNQRLIYVILVIGDHADNNQGIFATS